MDLLNSQILDNSLKQWLIAAVIATFTVVVLRLIQHITGRRLVALARGTESPWHSLVATLVEKTQLLFLLIIGLVTGSLLLVLSEQLRSVISSVFILALLLQAGVWGGSLILNLLDSYRQRIQEENPAAGTTINIIAVFSKIILWSIIVLLALDNLGVNITSLVAGLGIGGVAIALAVQNILGDLFSSLSIVLDKPFLNGDFVVIDNFLGSVEHIGLKTTRIRSLSGEQLVFSNSDLLNSRIRNYGRMFERRVVFSIGVIYQTPRDKLKRIPEIIRKAVEEEVDTRFDRSHFMKYGDFALQFETVYYVLSPDYNTYMDIQQSIYYSIHEQFEREDIQFAYPTQTLFVTQPSS